jgi:hypothetical protein
MALVQFPDRHGLLQQVDCDQEALLVAQRLQQLRRFRRVLLILPGRSGIMPAFYFRID